MAQLAQPAPRTRNAEAVFQFTLLFIFLGVFALLSLLAPNFFTLTNQLNILRQAAPTLIVAVGMTLVITTGGIDLSVGSLLALVAVLSAISLAALWPVWVVVLVMLALGLGVGLINGYFTAYQTIPAFIVTLATLSIFRGLAQLLTQGYSVPIDPDSAFLELGRGRLGPIPIPVIIAFVVVVVGYIVLNQTRFGTYVTGIGSNEEGVRRAGVDVRRVKTIVYMLSGFLRVAVGDRVWGTVHPRQRHTTAAAADYVVVPLDRVGPAPASLSATDAAALVVAGTTALRALDDVLGVRAGQRVLVRGAAGGVGTAAVQLAAARGARVSALASARHADALRALGASAVVDRASTDLADLAAGGPFHAVLDTVGTQLAGVRRAAGRRGRTVTIAISGPALGAIALSSVHGAARIRTFSADPHRTDLDALAAEVDSGHLRPVVAAVHPFDAIAEAHRAFARGGAVGKQVLDMTGVPSR